MFQKKIRKNTLHICACKVCWNDSQLPKMLSDTDIMQSIKGTLRNNMRWSVIARYYFDRLHWCSKSCLYLGNFWYSCTNPLLCEEKQWTTISNVGLSSETTNIAAKVTSWKNFWRVFLALYSIVSESKRPNQMRPFCILIMGFCFWFVIILVLLLTAH